VGKPKHGTRGHAEIESWELDLIRTVAGKFRTTERNELEGELARKLLVLKGQSRLHVRNWRAYVWRFLWNKASNWVRDCRVREGKNVGLSEERSEAEWEDPAGSYVPSAPDEKPDDRIAFARAWQELDTELRRLWETLVEEEDNQAKVARRLGMHRNTVRLWIQKIRRIFAKHGF
jgi:DNA-directed RNA polymerase specialized sigma24 family protein